MIFEKTLIPEVIHTRPNAFKDKRGYFIENFENSFYREHNIPSLGDFRQDNLSYSTKGVVRGLHYQQQPYPQEKLVSVIKGEIFDVAVDIRKDSPTYGQWVGKLLSSALNNQLFIPYGFAHGFQVVSDEAYVMYKVNEIYSKKHERAILWNDPKLKINWPMPKYAIVSEKDQKAPLFSQSESM